MANYNLTQTGEEVQELLNKVSLFGKFTCSDAADSQVKNIHIDDFTLIDSVAIAVTFVNGNSAASIQLNVNYTGNVPVYYRNSPLGAGLFTANATVILMYNSTGNRWDVLSELCGTIGEAASDISAAHPDGQGNPTPYADLTAALGTGGINIPEDIRKGGMSIKFIQGTVQSSDNKYVQYRLMKDSFSTDVADWQSENADDELTAGSNNLAKSGETFKMLQALTAAVIPTTLVPVYSEEGYYVTENGYYDSMSSQKTDFVYVKKGTKVSVTFETGSVVLRYGFFQNIPSHGATTSERGVVYVSPASIIVGADSYLALSYNKNYEITIASLGMSPDENIIKGSNNTVKGGAIYNAFKNISEEFTAIVRYSGTTGTSYGWVAEVNIPAGCAVRNIGTGPVNLYDVKNTSSANRVLVRPGNAIITTFAVTWVRGSGTTDLPFELIVYADKKSVFTSGGVEYEKAIDESVNSEVAVFGYKKIPYTLAPDLVHYGPISYYKKGVLSVNSGQRFKIIGYKDSSRYAFVTSYAGGADDVVQVVPGTSVVQFGTNTAEIVIPEGCNYLIWTATADGGSTYDVDVFEIVNVKDDIGAVKRSIEYCEDIEVYKVNTGYHLDASGSTASADVNTDVTRFNVNEGEIYIVSGIVNSRRGGVVLSLMETNSFGSQAIVLEPNMLHDGSFKMAVKVPNGYHYLAVCTDTGVAPSLVIMTTMKEEVYNISHFLDNIHTARDARVGRKLVSYYATDNADTDINSYAVSEGDKIKVSGVVSSLPNGVILLLREVDNFIDKPIQQIQVTVAEDGSFEKEFVVPSGYYYLHVCTDTGTVPKVIKITTVKERVVKLEERAGTDEGSIENNTTSIEQLKDKVRGSMGMDAGTVKAASMSDGDSIVLDGFPYHCYKGLAMSFYADITSFSKIIIGKGFEQYRGQWIEIDTTNIVQKEMGATGPTTITTKSTNAHGLTIDTFIKVSLSCNYAGKCQVVVQTLTGYYKVVLDWGYQGNYAAFVKSNGSSLTSCVFNATNTDFRLPVWIFGDSYLGISSNRWPGCLKEFGYFNWMQDNLAGIAALQSYADLQRALNFGTPKYLVWCLGANNYLDLSVAIDYFERVIALCEEKDITPILYTMPNVPERDYSAMNTWVRASGKRFIDLEKAVGMPVYESGVNHWYGAGTANDYLSADLVHPSAIGAQAMATQVLVDFPEIMQYGLYKDDTTLDDTSSDL